jgi:hypothetical protein
MHHSPAPTRVRSEKSGSARSSPTPVAPQFVVKSKDSLDAVLPMKLHSPTLTFAPGPRPSSASGNRSQRVSTSTKVSPSKWRYLREGALLKMATAKTCHHVVAQALRAWCRHVRMSTRNLALWLTGRLAQRLREQEVAVMFAKLRLACAVSRRQAGARLRSGWAGFCATVYSCRRVRACRCLCLWRKASSIRAHHRRLCRRLQSRRLRRGAREWLRTQRQQCVLLERLRRVVARHASCLRHAAFITWRRVHRNRSKAAARFSRRQLGLLLCILQFFRRQGSRWRGYKRMLLLRTKRAWRNWKRAWANSAHFALVSSLRSLSRGGAGDSGCISALTYSEHGKGLLGRLARQADGVYAIPPSLVLLLRSARRRCLRALLSWSDLVVDKQRAERSFMMLRNHLIHETWTPLSNSYAYALTCRALAAVSCLR